MSERSPAENKQIELLRDCYHAIKHYIEDGTSATRHNLWLQSQVIKSHLLLVECVAIDKDYRNTVSRKRPNQE